MKTIDKKRKLIIIGLLLGDANIQVFQKEEPITTARLRVLHSTKQIDYLNHKFVLFHSYIRQKRVLFLEEQTKTKTYHKCYFNTLTLKQFAFFYHMFYKKDLKTGKTIKILPRLIHRYLEPITLAYWYMDDGSLKWKNHSKAVRICTDSFSKSEVEHLVYLLNTKYDLKARTFKARSRLRIYIPNTNREFSQLIEQYIHPSMVYKVP
mmetsp:Transcript_35962/g.101838  ORF Transcript_35962/g.101838 Transcript_35962/m.101838 type:complete len:207 (+) Transcript_35962:266-886(+)